MLDNSLSQAVIISFMEPGLVALVTGFLWHIYGTQVAGCQCFLWNFDNQERTLEELKSFFCFSLLTWTVASLAPLVISFFDFLVLFSLSS